MIDPDTRPAKMPRHYAAEILALRTREERAAALEQVPRAWREWVRQLVVDYFAIRRAS